MEPSVIIGLSYSETVGQLLQARYVTPCQAFQGNQPIRIGRSFHSVSRNFSIDKLSVQFVPISRAYTSPSVPVIPGLSEIDDALRRDFAVRDSTDAVALLEKIPDPTPWFTSFVADLDDALLFNPIQFVQEPLCVVCVASEDDPDPVGSLSEQRDFIQNNPSLFSSISPDTTFPMKYLLLSDASLNGSKSGSLFESMQSSFHPSMCAVLDLDFATVSSSDVNPAIRSFVFDLLTLTVLPDLEFRIRTLNTSIANVRKGFRNQLKNLFGGRKAAKSELMAGFNPNAPVEVQIRQLADYAYLIGDLPLAFENYRLFASDCRGKERLRCELGLAETGVAVCGALILSQSPQLLPSLTIHEVEQSLDAAVHAFLGAGVLACAARTAAIAALLSRNLPGLSRLAAALLLRVGSTDNGPMAALFLEQSAFVFLCARPPLCRQYAFHLTRAGHTYQKLQIRHHAIRCFKDALALYSGRSWCHIEDHIRFKLGRESFNIGDYDTSVSHYVSLVGGGRQRQDTFLKEFIIVAKRAGLLDQIFSVQLPRIRVAEVVFGDRYQLPHAISDDVWQQPELYFHHDLQSCWDLCVWTQPVSVGAVITVKCRVRNPLQLTLQMTRFRLDCLLDGAQDGLVVSEHDFVLAETDSIDMTLNVCCTAAGQLQLCGFRWTILDVIQAQSAFTYAPTDINIPKQLNRMKRWMQAGAHVSPLSPMPLPTQFRLKVVDYSPALPHISIRFSELPTETLHGEVRFVQLLLDLSYHEPVEVELKVTSSGALLSVSDRASSSKLGLVPGRNQFPCTLYASESGPARIQLLLNYKTFVKTPDHLVTFFAHDLLVKPSLYLQPSIRLSSDKIPNRMLDVAIDNHCPDMEFGVERISLQNRGDPGYAVEDLGSQTVRIRAQESANLLLRLIPTALSLSSVIYAGDGNQCEQVVELLDRNRPQVLLFWRSHEHNRHGIVTATLDYNKLVDGLTCPLRLTIDFEPTTMHDFTKELLKAIPVTVSVFNSTDSPIAFDFECLDHDQVFDPETRQFLVLSNASCAGRYFWSGVTTRRNIHLQPNQTASIDLNACFLNAGVFNLNRFKFMIQADVPRLFFFPVQRLVRVVQEPRLQSGLSL